MYSINFSHVKCERSPLLSPLIISGRALEPPGGACARQMHNTLRENKWPAFRPKRFPFWTKPEHSFSKEILGYILKNRENCCISTRTKSRTQGKSDWNPPYRCIVKREISLWGRAGSTSAVGNHSLWALLENDSSWKLRFEEIKRSSRHFLTKCRSSP